MAQKLFQNAVRILQSLNWHTINSTALQNLTRCQMPVWVKNVFVPWHPEPLGKHAQARQRPEGHRWEPWPGCTTDLHYGPGRPRLWEESPGGCRSRHRGPSLDQKKSQSAETRSRCVNDLFSGGARNIICWASGHECKRRQHNGVVATADCWLSAGSRGGPHGRS